jgi:hypothetical protein
VQLIGQGATDQLQAESRARRLGTRYRNAALQPAQYDARLFGRFVANPADVQFRAVMGQRAVLRGIRRQLVERQRERLRGRRRQDAVMSLDSDFAMVVE